MMRAVGEMPEWPNGTDSKSVVLATVPRVQIPISPPLFEKPRKSLIYGAFLCLSVSPVAHCLCPLYMLAPLAAIPKPVLVTPDPSRERVPGYAPIALPRVTQTSPAPSVMAYDVHIDDQPEWMRDVA
jgi:hypothetical protein